MRPSTFMFHKLAISSPEYSAIRFNTRNVPDEAHHRISECNTEMGSFNLNEVITEDFELCYGHLMVSRDVRLSVKAKHRFLGLVFSLGDEMKLSVGGFGTAIRRSGEYGLVYVPEIDVQGTLQEKHNYFFLAAGIRKERYLSYFQDDPAIANMVRDMRAKKASSIGSFSGNIPGEVQDILNAVAARCEGYGLLSQVEVHFVNTKMHELLNRVLKDRKWSEPTSLFTEAEAKALERIHKHLIDHLGADPGTLNELGKIAGMSSNLMNRRFKEMYGKTIFKYLRQKRWEKAEELLRQNVELHEIASAVGYSSVAHFTAAFTREHGMSPGKMRATMKINT